MSIDRAWPPTVARLAHEYAAARRAAEGDQWTAYRLLASRMAGDPDDDAPPSALAALRESLFPGVWGRGRVCVARWPPRVRRRSLAEDAVCDHGLVDGMRIDGALDGIDWSAVKGDLAADEFDNGRSPAALRHSFEVDAG